MKPTKKRYSRSWREPKRVTPETTIKKMVKQYLSLKGWFVFSILQGLGAHKGIPDIIALKDGLTIFLEIKSKNGNQSEHQKEFERRVTTSGGIYLVVRDIDELIYDLDAIGRRVVEGVIRRQE